MKRKLNNEELITFCSQMALILKSGISSLEGIYIMEDGDVSGDGREILKEIREEIEMCGMLYPAMKKSGVFPEYALHMTEIGEQTGRLDETMEALAAYYQREEEIFEAVNYDEIIEIDENIHVRFNDAVFNVCPDLAVIL